MWARAVKQTEHNAVLLDAAMAALAVRPAGVYVDATYGRGGHSAALLERLGPEGRLLAFDKDPDACAAARARFGDEPRFSIHNASFARLGDILREHRLSSRIDGLLLDLGVSSPQLDDGRRGFSFTRDGPLDMRMDPAGGVSAAQWLADAGHGEIARVLKRYGEEPLAGRIASAIVAAREREPITTTGQLARIIESAVPARVAAGSRIHPATRSFQAVRIHINRELEELAAVLEQSLAALAPGGRLAAISFHSLEDRIVKRFLREAAHPEPPPVPMAAPEAPRLRLIGKPRRATEAEVAANPRARSAILRVAERTAEGAA